MPLPVQSVDLNPSTPCTGLESCSPLVLLLVGNFTEGKQVLVCVQERSTTPDTTHRQLMENDDPGASAKEQQEVSAPGRPLLSGVICYLLHSLLPWPFSPAL